MEKSTFSPAYGVVRVKLVAMRRAAGMTQRELANKLRRERSFVARIEQGERRLDLVEFYWVCRACGARPEEVVRELMREIRARDMSGGPTRARLSRKARPKRRR